MSARVGDLTVADLERSGLLTHATAIADVTERYGVPGSNDPARVFVSRVLGGFEHEVIASRGLDIGYTSWRGIPISWHSPVRDARPLDKPAGADWISRFTGGLLVTCGPFNIGEDDGIHGMHGDFSHRAAASVAARECDGGTAVSGSIEVSDLFGPSLAVERTILSESGDGFARLTVTDRVRNAGRVPAHVAMLYHLNFGAPLVAPGSRVSVDAEHWRFAQDVPEVPTPTVLPPACDRMVEAVASYSNVHEDKDGWAHAVVSRQGAGIDLDIAWRPSALPYLYQWIYPTKGRWALAIEPASAALFANDALGPEGAAPNVPPGGSRLHEISITARDAA